MFIDLRKRSRFWVAAITLLLALIVQADLQAADPGPIDRTLATSRNHQAAEPAASPSANPPGHYSPLAFASGSLLAMDDAASTGAVDPERQRLGQAGGAHGNQPGQGRGGGGGAVWRTLGALAVVIGLVVVGRAVLVRLGVASPGAGRSAGKAVQVLAAVPVAHRQQILLLRAGPRVLVVGQTNQSLRTLAQFDDPTEVANLLEQVGQPAVNPAVGLRFEGMLTRFNQSYQQPEGKP